GCVGVLAGVLGRSGGGAHTCITGRGVSAGRALTRRSTGPGCIWGGLGFWLGSVFAPGAVLLHEIPVAACRRGVLLQETSARPAAVLVRVGGGMEGGPGRRGRRGGFAGAGGRRCIPRPGRRRYPARGRAR